jgi:hypothetical protein
VLLLGEFGTGKDVAAFPNTLPESELFGHDRSTLPDTAKRSRTRLGVVADGCAGHVEAGVPPPLSLPEPYAAAERLARLISGN